MKYNKIMLLICLSACILLSVSCAFATDGINETVSGNDEGVLQAYNDTQTVGDSSYSSEVYFDASSASDGVGTKSNPYKYYKADRVNYGDTVYFADGVYDITEPNSIYSSAEYQTTFIGQSADKTILRSGLANKFDFTVTDNSYFALNNLTLLGVHINNQANLIANNVVFRSSTGFNPNYQPSLSYSYISNKYDSSYGGAIICDTPSGKVTTLNFNSCQFLTSSAVSGGVIATYNTVANFQDCVFYNSTAERFGGAIYSIKSNFTIKDSSFGLGDAKYGGMIYSDSSNLNLVNIQFLQSQAYSFGGVIAAVSSKLDLNHVSFTDYASLNDGGGAIYSTGGTVKVVDCLFKNGYSDFGGAICNLKCNTTIEDSQFINTEAIYYGGSIYNMYGNIVINANEFNNTRATSGGTIFNRLYDSFKLTNNRFTNSTADEAPIVFIDGDKVTITQSGNTYDTSLVFLKYGNIYDTEYYKSVPVIYYTAESVDILPSIYDSRKYGYVTPAKDQIQGGNCWAFSGIATLEACLKKATGIEYDFSEENVKNLMSEYSLFDSDSDVNTGGNLYMFIAYLAGWFGPTYDEYDVYDDYSSLSVIYDSIVHVQNVYILPERESVFDNDYIKRAVMEYGAVSIGIDLSTNQGHAVTIVGWDDEFASNDFLGNKAVGAWIIKNSWGTEWGYDGYGYLSYQQPISFGYTFIFDDERGYSDVYQYDFSGKSGYHRINSQEVYIKNKFTAKNDEILSAFSTYFDEATDYTASIYLNGQLITTQSGYSELGYYTIPLEKEVSMKKGDTFEVVVKITNGAPVYIPICDADEINKISFGAGISFYSIDGVNWYDLYDSTSPGVACIKAFTREKALEEISISLDSSSGGASSFGNVYVDDLINIPLNLPEYYVVDGVQYPVDGLVTFTVNGENYFATVENGKAVLNITFEKEGTYDVTAQFKSNRVTSNVISFQINVAKTDLSNLIIEANDVSKFYGGSEKYVATLTKAGSALSGVNVKISANGKNYTSKTDANGQVSLDLDLPVGVYEITAQYGGKVVSSRFTVLTTIGVENLTQDFLDSYVSASFINTDGNVLSDRVVTFVVKVYGVNSVPVKFNATTNQVGIASAKLNLYTGKYSVSVANPVNGEEKQFVLDIVQIDSTCSLSVTQTGSDVTINATVSPTQTSGYVNFLIGGNVYKVDVTPIVIDNNRVAVASLTLSNLAVGNYEVTAVFSGDSNLKVSSSSREFTVTKNPYKLQSNNYWSYYGGSGTIARLIDENGNPIQGQTISATINNKTYKATTDKDGNATFHIDLDVGNYTVLFEYNGQSLLKHVFVYSTINVVTSSGEYLNSRIGAYVVYPFEGTQPESLDVKFIIDGKEYNVTADSNGYASVDADLPVGTHIITIVNLCNGEVKESKITIYKTTPSITLTKSKRGEYTLFTASLSQTSAIGNVVFTMGSKKYTSSVVGGNAILALNNMEEGSYEVYANYIGDLNFNNIISSTLKFDFAYTNYSMSAPKLSKYYGGSEKFAVTLTNYNNPVSNAVINVTIGDKVYYLKTDSNGVASYSGVLDPGVYSVRCSYDDITVFSEITVKSTITVNGGSEDFSYTKTTAEFLDGSGNLIKNKDVTFKINSKEYKQTTDNLGIATLEVNLDIGNYTVSIINPTTGEVKYTTLIITKTTPTLTLSAVKVNGEDVLKATLPKTATGDVEFKLDNGDVYSMEIKDGVSTLKGIDPGEYTVVVTYNGNDMYYPVSKSIKFEVSEVVEAPLESVLMSSDVATTYGTGKNIVVSLKDSEGNILAGRTVTVNLNGINYQGVVQTDGNAAIAIPSTLAVNTYVATITYAGETDILSDNIKINVVVKKATPKFTAKNKSFKVKVKTKKYAIVLKTDKNVALKKQKVTIKVNGKKYTAKTNSKGKATFKITKLTKKGTFKAKITYSGNAYYNSIKKSVKITAK